MKRLIAFLVVVIFLGCVGPPSPRPQPDPPPVPSPVPDDSVPQPSTDWRASVVGLQANFRKHRVQGRELSLFLSSLAEAIAATEIATTDELNDKMKLASTLFVKLDTAYAGAPTSKESFLDKILDVPGIRQSGELKPEQKSEFISRLRTASEALK